jgi:hypothetical protein
MTNDMPMTNDKAVFDAMRFDIRAGQDIWSRRTGTREAINRDGYRIDPMSLRYCPHEWIDDRGYVDLELSREHPYPHHSVPA